MTKPVSPGEPSLAALVLYGVCFIGAVRNAQPPFTKADAASPRKDTAQYYPPFDGGPWAEKYFAWVAFKRGESIQRCAEQYNIDPSFFLRTETSGALKLFRRSESKHLWDGAAKESYKHDLEHLIDGSLPYAVWFKTYAFRKEGGR